MSNALTSINDYAYDRDLSNVNNLQKKIDNNKDGKTFTELFKEKLNKDGSVNENKLEGKDKKLYKACLDLESLLWKQVLNEMKKTTNKYKLLDGGQGEEIFTDFLYDEYASMMSKNANTRISDTLFKQLSGYR
ncbi:MAG TPA: rod-binding protein [Spirochaetota bacterium]|nr:rod-binding protein [Spirochaetota bacterium]